MYKNGAKPDLFQSQESPKTSSLKHLPLHHHQFLIYDAQCIHLPTECHLHTKCEDFVKPVGSLLIIDCVLLEMDKGN